MQIKDIRPESFTAQIRCDRCGLLASGGEVEFHEMTCIDAKAGYGSIFGDGNEVQVDLCQHCLKLTLGSWLRVTERGPHDVRLLEKLSLFDLEKHGGEFPTRDDRLHTTSGNSSGQGSPQLSDDKLGLAGKPRPS